MTRRPVRVAEPSVVTLRLRDGREWAPARPPEGWTPESALAAAVEFSGGDRRRAAEAHRALLVGVPGLHRADLVARLRERGYESQPQRVTEEPPPF